MTVSGANQALGRVALLAIGLVFGFHNAVAAGVEANSSVGTVAKTARLPVVAITGLDSRGVTGNDVSVISDNLATQLQQSGKFRVMERSQMDKILREQNFQLSVGCEDNQCAVEIGKLLGIDRIVVGSVGLVGSTYSLNLRLVDVGTGEALQTSSRNRRGSIDDVLIELVPAAVADLSRQVTQTQVVTKAAPAPTPAAPAPVASESNKGSVWPWILGGTVVAGGAATAYLLLNSGENSTPAPGPNQTAPDHFKITW